MDHPYGWAWPTISRSSRRKNAWPPPIKLTSPVSTLITWRKSLSGRPSALPNSRPCNIWERGNQGRHSHTNPENGRARRTDLERHRSGPGTSPGAVQERGLKIVLAVLGLVLRVMSVPSYRHYAAWKSSD